MQIHKNKDYGNFRLYWYIFSFLQPSPEESELYNQAEGCLTEANKILNELTNYKGKFESNITMKINMNKLCVFELSKYLSTT